MTNFWEYRSEVSLSSCNCIGPQRGEPYCPCLMRDKGVFQRNGRWIEPEQDLGPVQNLTNIWENMK
jgi:hypothetical protein